VDLLLQHRTGRVLIVGDFDADGATSTALMVRALTAWGFASVDFLVPEPLRIRLRPHARNRDAGRHAFTDADRHGGQRHLEHGRVSRTHARKALTYSSPTIIWPAPGCRKPTSSSIPNLAGSTFGSRSLAGVGVAFYVMAAVRRRLDAEKLTPPGAPSVAEFLDLVALGTVADVVPLDSNNRVLVAQGLKRIRAGRCVAGHQRAPHARRNRRINDLTATDVAFAVAPRLNAAGRMDDMTIGIQCLLSDDPTAAQMLAARLDELNQERRATEARMQVEALAAVSRLRDTGPRAVHRSGVCLYDESWHQGVVGLVASRVKDRVRRPVIAFALASDETLRGSARSVPGIHIRDVLDAVAARDPDLISKFGGHAMAAGLTLDLAKLDRFAALSMKKSLVGPSAVQQPMPSKQTASCHAGDSARNRACAARRRPVGPGISRAVFRWRLLHPQYPRGRRASLENVGRSPTNRSRFRCNCLQPHRRARELRPPEGAVQLVYRLDVNEYQGERRLQLLVDHVLPVQTTAALPL
jgi:single-stranded-DNA-specific exonuclease